MADEPTTSELLELASRQCNGQLDDDGLARLESLLAGNPGARQEYLRYTFLHAHLATSDAALQSVFDPAELQALTAAAEEQEILLNLPEISLASQAREARYPRHWVKRMLLVSTAALLLFVPFLLLLNYIAPPSEFRGVANPGSVAKVIGTTNAQWKGIDELLPGQPLYPGTLRLTDGQASLRFGDGTDVAFGGPTMFGVVSESFASVFSGRVVARMNKAGRAQAAREQFVLQARGVRVVDLGTEFGVDVDPFGITEVHCFEGEVQTFARVRSPVFYWTFDDRDGPVRDEIEKQDAFLGPGVKRVDGLIGKGALAFDNSPGASVNVGNKDGTRLGTGRLGVSSGITIEALTVVGWSGDGISTGKPLDYDEIFRKEDGSNRLLLCFQNDNGANQRMVPEIPANIPTLSFGLHLANDGYSELEAPLDGRDGRPSLAELRDGKPHHIVATYNSWTGEKTLYIDGQLCQKAKFPEGTLIICGGRTDAIIGNMAGGGEPYSGTIDEVAIYDFALWPSEIAEHWRNVQAGKNYFGADGPAGLRQDLWRSVTVLKAGEAMRFDSESGVALGAIDANEGQFRKQVAGTGG